MSIPSTVCHQGVLSGSPAASSTGLTLQDIFNTNFSLTLGVSKSARPSIVGATDVSPYVIPLETITKVRCIAIRSPDRSSFVVKLTSSKGSLQAIPCSGVFLWQGTNSGDEVTVIQIVGTVDLEYFIAGDSA
jgi:hypothetical protein